MTLTERKANLMKPHELVARFTKIVSEESGCPAAWTQHEGPLTSPELYKIKSRFEVLLRALIHETVDREIEARRRVERVSQ